VIYETQTQNTTCNLHLHLHADTDNNLIKWKSLNITTHVSIVLDTVMCWTPDTLGLSMLHRRVSAI
jgi:hypothetical protein